MPHQVIFVHGFFGWGPQEVSRSLPYWGEAENADPFKEDEDKKARFASVGPISSNHDRACELFYQIKGGDCNYGKEHAEQHQHTQILTGWKKGIAPLYPDWNEDKPIHLVCHSQGTPTARILQHLLDNDHFSPEHETNATWIKSITSISGANNGTTLLYRLGCSDKTGKVERSSIIASLAKRAPVLAKHLVSPGYNFDLDQWGLVANEDEPVLNLFDKEEAARFISGEDNAFFDLTLHGMHQWNQVLKEYLDTYYFSYPTYQTVRIPFTNVHMPGARMNPALWAFSWLIGTYSFSNDFRNSLPEELNSSDWRQNDGILPGYSQDFPRIPNEHPYLYCDKDQNNFQPGRWNVMDHKLASWDHWDITVFPGIRRAKQRQFYQELFTRLNGIP
jgi:triacylglycerol lipase